MNAPRIIVDTDSGVSPWRQVRDQITELVLTGQLAIGARLPTIRQLAGDLGLAAGTVARAYRELETEGVLRTGRRQGTQVAAMPTLPAEPDPLGSAAVAFAIRARALGADVDAAVAAVQTAYDR